MKLKGIELNGTYKLRCDATRFLVYDEKGNAIYFEKSNGFWEKWEYNEKGNVIYFENSNGEIGFDTLAKFCYGERVKELTIEEIEKLLGYKIKIKGEK